MFNRSVGLMAAVALRSLSAWAGGDQKKYDRYEKRTIAHNGGYQYKPNGAKECARRRRQIEAGSLKAENGLVL